VKKLLSLAGVLLLVVSCVTGPSIPRDAMVLGEKEVNFKADHDVIQVGAYEGFFKSLYFVVEKKNVQIYDLVITYGNGERESFDSRLVFDSDSRSRYLALDGPQRRIETIAFAYKTVGNWQDGRADVMVYGLK
jgi:hypothetical protein